MQLGTFNIVSTAQAAAVVEPCLGAERWVNEVVAARPYADLAALHAQGFASAQQLTDEELDAALASHPRIGDRVSAPSGPSAAGGTGVDHARSEQSGLDSADPETAERLLLGNEDYEARFGRVFLIRASGRSCEEVLTELARRLDNNEVDERREVVTQLRDIALRRLDRVVSP